MPQLPLSPLAQKSRDWPPFFDGRMRMQIVMALSTFGPMRLMEIAALTAESARHVRHWNEAAMFLEDSRVIIRQKKHPTHLVLGLDRRHPAFREIQWFGKKLYEIYLAPDAPKTPPGRRKPLKIDGPPFEPAEVNQDVLGDKVRLRVLRLLVEISACPGYVLVESLGVRHYEAISRWERYGVLLCRSGRQRKRKRWSAHLDRTWPAHAALYALLKKFNSWAPEYADMADIYREERRRHHHETKWKINATLRRRRAGPALRRAKEKRYAERVAGVRP